MRRFYVFFLCVCLLGGAVFAAAGDQHTFELTWQAEGFHKDLPAAMDRTEPFDKEPDTGGREVHRGVLHCDPAKPENDVIFLWDKSEGKLYIDLNRDGDLTNDPDGDLTTDNKDRGQYINQQFPEFQLSLTTDAGEHRYRLSARLTSYPGWQNANFTVSSNYQGTVELTGEKWGFRVVDALCGKIESGDMISIWPKSASETNRADSQRLPKTLFLYDRCYEVYFEFKAGDDNAPRLWCTLTEKDVPLATLKLGGKEIQQLVFGDSKMLVLPRLSEEGMTVPVGQFQCKQLALKPQENRPAASPQDVREIAVSVAADTENVLKVGAPLNHTVKVERSGKMLKFNYELVGAGGEKYDYRAMTGYSNDNKPKVTIYKGDLQLASGEFEYG